VAHVFLEPPTSVHDLRRLFHWINDDAPGEAGDCTPPMDVVETADAIEVSLDLPGPIESLKVVFRQDLLLVSGEKRPPQCRHDRATFHLAERGFGRFARGVRLSGAFDTGRATAELHAGELRVTLPRIAERRGAERVIAVTAD
jgi:HSP20 family protein